MMSLPLFFLLGGGGSIMDVGPIKMVDSMAKNALIPILKIFLVILVFSSGYNSIG